MGGRALSGPLPPSLHIQGKPAHQVNALRGGRGHTPFTLHNIDVQGGEELLVVTGAG